MWLQRGRPHRQHHHPASRAESHVPERDSAGPAPRPRARRGVGALHADRGASILHAHAALIASTSLHAVAVANSVYNTCCILVIPLTSVAIPHTGQLITQPH